MVRVTASLLTFDTASLVTLHNLTHYDHLHNSRVGHEKCLAISHPHTHTPPNWGTPRKHAHNPTHSTRTGIPLDPRESNCKIQEEFQKTPHPFCSNLQEALFLSLPITQRHPKFSNSILNVFQDKGMWKKNSHNTPDHLILDSAPNIGPLISRWELEKFKNC